MESEVTRRGFLQGVVATTGVLAGVKSLPAAPGTEVARVTAEEYLKKILYTRDEVEQWLALKAFPFAKYSSPFGWLLRDARFQDGLDGAINQYTYGPLDERITIHHREKRCRINTYGNSYTQCHQVADGETWQEVLAGHIEEPIRNFGVGGWSVYQAYLRMLHEEARNPAELIILNIYQDDHFRNLDSWRGIRVKKHQRFIEPTLPYVEVDVKADRFVERPNPCPTPESVYNLCDLDWVVNRFKDDFALKIVLEHANAKAPNPAMNYKEAMELAASHGIITRTETSKSFSTAADALHQVSAYYSTQKIVEKIEAYAQAQKKKVLYILSYPAQFIARTVKEGQRPDRPFVEFLQRKKLPVVDLLQAHLEEFAQYKGALTDYLRQYFVGHYNPRGNFFTAFAIKKRVVEMLNPKPLPYRPDPNVMKM
ncbi:MAG: hypothetical protein U0903_12670 [Planctomycetales bacterium]